MWHGDHLGSIWGERFAPFEFLTLIVHFFHVKKACVCFLIWKVRGDFEELRKYAKNVLQKLKTEY